MARLQILDIKRKASETVWGGGRYLVCVPTYRRAKKQRKVSIIFELTIMQFDAKRHSHKLKFVKTDNYKLKLAKMDSYKQVRPISEAKITHGSKLVEMTLKLTNNGTNEGTFYIALHPSHNPSL